MEQKQAIILFHTVCGNHGLTDDDKQAIYSSYGVDSSKKMSAAELIQVVNSLQNKAQSWRVRVMGAIGGYLNRNKIESNQAVIKAIACRAAKATDFNKIPVKELRKLYNLFLKKNNTVGGVAPPHETVVNYFESKDNHDNNDNHDNI